LVLAPDNANSTADPAEKEYSEKPDAKSDAVRSGARPLQSLPQFVESADYQQYDAIRNSFIPLHFISERHHHQ